MITLPVDTILRGLGRAVTYTKGTAKSLNGIFLAPYQAETIGGMLVQNTAPSIVLSTAEVSGADRTATVTIGSDVYHVVEVQPLGNGLTQLVLSKD